MRELLAVVCALGCLVGTAQAQTSDAQVQQVALAPVERMEAADGYPSHPPVKAVAAAQLTNAGPAQTPLPAGALLFAVAFWSTIWLTRRSRGEGLAPASSARLVADNRGISDVPAELESAPPVVQVERRRRSDTGSDRRSDGTLERRS